MARMTIAEYNALMKKKAVTNASKPRKAKSRPTPKNAGPDMFILLIKELLSVEATPEHRFHPTRKWRFDYALLEHKIAIEVEGGIWMKGGGAHSRPANIERDMEKYNQAMALGWRIIRVQPNNLCKTATFNLIGQYLR